MRYITLLLLYCSAAFAGQSIEYGAAQVYSNAIPNLGSSNTEMWIHDWLDPGAYTHVIGGGGIFPTYRGATCISVYFGVVDGAIGLNINEACSGTVATFIPLPGLAGAGGALLRFQHDTVNKVDRYEAWAAATGQRVFFTEIAYASETNDGTGFVFGNGSEPTVDVAFVRVSTTLVPLNSKPPVTFSTDPGRVFEWKFDCTGGLGGCPTGGLDDATGNGYTATYPGGTPTFINTPNQSPAVPVICANPTSWANITTLQAGTPLALDGTCSYSQADTSAGVTWNWKQISGPSQLVWGNLTSGTPQPKGAIWGDYQFQLKACDVNNSCASTINDVGVVAQDTKGIVVDADPNAQALLGDAITYGKNPWGYADYWQGDFAGPIRDGQYIGWGFIPSGPQWEQVGAGTVSYVWGGVNLPSGASCANTITGNINSTVLTIPISNASCLDLTSYPTRILLYTGAPGLTEEVRICSSSATSGAANLTVCYDGRGTAPSTAASWSSGSTEVAQNKVTGTSTQFITDVNSAVCPGGAPGPTGAVSYSTGTVTLAAGSATMTGSGTLWVANAAAGQYIRVAATHSSTPFVFVTQISSVGSDTSITLARAYPSDADTTGSLAYEILPGFRTIDLRGPHTVDPSLPGQNLWNVSGCESATALYLNPQVGGVGQTPTNEYASGHDSSSLPPYYSGNNGVTESGYQYSVTDSTAWVNQSSDGGISFYGEDLGMMDMCLRSGYKWACDAWHSLSNYLINSPWANIETQGIAPLFIGGLGIAAFVSQEIGAGSGPGSGQGPGWGELRSYAQQGLDVANSYYNSGSIDCEIGDTRDTAYSLTFLELGAMYDPSPTFRTRWLGGLTTMQLVDATCKRSDNSFSNAFLGDPSNPKYSFGPLTMTNGSKNVTPTTGTLAPGVCVGIATGTGTVVSGSGTLTVTGGTWGTAGGADTAIITGTKSGQPLTLWMEFDQSSGSSTPQLAGEWPGDTGSVTWMLVQAIGTTAMTSYQTSQTDYADMAQSYGCTYNSPTSITLDHPWAGTSSTSLYGFKYLLAGFGQQPYYDGINQYRLGILARSTDVALGSLPTTYAGYAAGQSAWLNSTGFDNVTKSVFYGRGYGFCEPQPIATNFSAGLLGNIQTFCSYPDTAFALAPGREENSEISNALSDYYIYNPGSPALTWGDQAYGAIYGATGYTQPGAYLDSKSTAYDDANYRASDFYPLSFTQGKYFGFFAGMGMLHRWPAQRLGGVDPTVTADIYQPFTLSGITGAAKVSITFTAPTGITSTTVCSSSPCHLTNIRQHTGWGLLKIDYENSGNIVIAPGVPLPLFIP